MKPLIVLLLIISLQAISSAKTINIDNISNQAKSQNRQLLIFFHMTYCGYCKKMIRTTLNDKRTAQKIEKNFTLLSLNINKNDSVIYKNFKGSIHDFARSLKINLYPSIIFIGENKEVIGKIEGYRGVESFSTVLEYFSTKSYKTMELDSFINELDFNQQ